MSALRVRSSRLLSILITLQLKGRVSARELAAQFEVSKRTIYRDVEALSAAGVPVYAELGAAGGFALLDGWQTRLTGMTPREAQALAFAQLPDAAGELGLAAEAAAARLKFLASLPEASSAPALQVSDRFHLDPAPWYRRPGAGQPLLKMLAQAVWESRRIQLRYQSWQGSALRTLEPLGVVLKAGEWYFVALRSRGASIYKLASVQELILCEETFRRPAGFDLAGAWRQAVLGFERSLRRESAVLRVAAAALSGLDRLGADLSEPLRAARPDEQGIRQATVPIESVAHAAGLLLGFADDIEVLSPPALRAELKRRALAVTKLY